MKTFFNILQSVSGCSNKNKTYPTEPFVSCVENVNCENGNITYLINNMYHKFASYKHTQNNYYTNRAFSKFFALKSILENIFFSNELKEHIFDIFSKSQKYYHAFSRLAHIYKIKKHKYAVLTDLSMNTLDINDKLTFVLVENNTNYLFNINELCNIIETAIGHCPNFFLESLNPLNPYNNQTLSKSTLYNIYFHMKNIKRVIPLLFHCFFLTLFNKDIFELKYEYVIRENAIKKYVFNSPPVVLYNHVFAMLNNNIYTKKLIISPNFSKNEFVDIFRPFLFHYFIANYYIQGSLMTENSSKLLNYKLYKFYQYNPKFGQTNIITTDNWKTCKLVINTKHLSFYNIIDNIHQYCGLT